MPSGWVYDVYPMAGPGELKTLRPVQRGRVFAISATAATLKHPGGAMPPLGVAAAIGDLMAEALTYLAQESGKPRGAYLATPKDGADDTIEGLKTDTRNAAGQVLFVESQANNWDSGGMPSGEWMVKHFGPSVGPGMVETAKMARSEALAALGLNEALFMGADSAALREAWRLALFSLIGPLGQLVESEIRAKIDPSITLSWTELRASDLAGRARAFQSLIGGGMDIEKATAISGLMVDGS